MTPQARVTFEKKLRNSGLRPTRQRLALAELLYSKGDRHISAEDLHAEALAANVPVSLATIYNALNQFTMAGLLREVAIEGQRTYFDTNTSSHHHFYIESEERLVDIPHGSLRVVGVPQTPSGKEIDRIDVIVRLRDV